MSGRPNKEQEAEFDRRAAEVYAIYSQGGITYQDIAEQLGISLKATGRLLERARRNNRTPPSTASLELVDEIDLQQRQIRIDQKRIEERLEEVSRENTELIERQRRELAELKNKAKGWTEW